MPTIPALPQSFAEALQIAADNQKQVEAQAAQIAAVTFRCEASAATVDAEGLSSFAVSAKTLRVLPGEIWVLRQREPRVYERNRDGTDVAIQTKIDIASLTHKTVPVVIG